MVLLSRATEAFTTGHLDRCEALLNQRARQVDATALDWLLRARIAQGRNRPDEALAFMKHVSDGDPLAPQRWLLEGQVELNRDRAGTAELALRRVIAMNPNSFSALKDLAYILAMQHRQNETDAVFRALAEASDADYRVAFLWCQSACDIWDPKEAGARLEKFVLADPEDRFSRLALALSYQRDGHPDAAERTLAPLPLSDIDARALRARLALDRNDEESAERLAKENPPEHAPSNVLRGRLALGRRDAAAAALRFQAALKAEPDNRDALNGLGQALRMQNDHAAAEVFLEQARRRDTLKRLILDSRQTLKTDPKLFSKLAATCESIPLRPQATLWYRLAIGIDPLDTQSQQALARLVNSSKTRSSQRD
jgi:predicted Zn-dependent protease